MKLKVYFYKSLSGKEVVANYIGLLEKDATRAIHAFLMRLQSDVKFRRMPYCRKIQGDIFEIRIKTSIGYRILFAYIWGDSIVLLHIFKKKTNKISKKELKLAINRLKMYE